MKSLTTLEVLQATFFALLALALTARVLLLSYSASAAKFLLGQELLLSLSLSLSWCALVAVAAYHFTPHSHPVLLLDYSCYLPNHDRRCSYEVSEYFVRRTRRFCAVSEEFSRSIYSKSGLGDETYAPPFLFQTDYEAKLASAIQEVEEGMFSAVDSVLSKSRVDPSQIEVLIVACSMFTPCPSLSALVASHYGFKPTIKTFSLSGMGCSAGALSIDLAARILRRKPGSYALIVTTESTSLNWYFGDSRPMLVTNCIFRVGSAAVLLTSDTARRHQAKMELVRTLRTHHGADDASYGAAVQEEDEDGNVGVSLKKDLVRVAGAGLRDHIRALAPRVLPISQLLLYAYSSLRWPWAAAADDDNAKKVPHVPDFTTAFEHMCIHTGGKAVIDAVGRVMRLPEAVLEPARMTLHRFGNTSSSLVFYQLAYFEAKRSIRKGDRVWMVAFGTGFKACSLVWRAICDSPPDGDNPWNHCIHRYPV